MTFLQIIITLIVAAVLWFLASRSPLPEPYKGWIGWLILAAAVLYILFGVFGHASFLNQRVGS